MKLWKRNAIVVAIVVFVGAAVYLNWTYGQGQQTAGGGDPSPSGRVLGEAALVSGKADAEKDSGGAGKQDAARPGEDAAKTGGDAAQTDAKAGTGTGETTGYFSTARLKRQQARDSALEILRQAAEDAMAEQTVIDGANASIQKLAANTLSEAQVENLVTAKGYADCVCYINDNSASVVVSATENGLTDADTARICEIVMDETGLAARQITIIEAKP